MTNTFRKTMVVASKGMLPAKYVYYNSLSFVLVKLLGDHKTIIRKRQKKATLDFGDITRFEIVVHILHMFPLKKDFMSWEGPNSSELQ